jgi:hypothetical protein
VVHDIIAPFEVIFVTDLLVMLKVVVLETTTDMELVLLFPAASKTLAVRECEPLVAVLVFQE